MDIGYTYIFPFTLVVYLYIIKYKWIIRIPISANLDIFCRRIILLPRWPGDLHCMGGCFIDLPDSGDAPEDPVGGPRGNQWAIENTWYGMSQSGKCGMKSHEITMHWLSLFKYASQFVVKTGHDSSL